MILLRPKNLGTVVIIRPDWYSDLAVQYAAGSAFGYFSWAYYSRSCAGFCLSLPVCCLVGECEQLAGLW